EPSLQTSDVTVMVDGKPHVVRISTDPRTAKEVSRTDLGEAKDTSAAPKARPTQPAPKPVGGLLYPYVWEDDPDSPEGGSWVLGDPTTDTSKTGQWSTTTLDDGSTLQIHDQTGEVRTIAKGDPAKLHPDKTVGNHILKYNPQSGKY